MTPAELDEEVVPRPSALIESLRSFGYTPETSVADLIDNSLAAGATSIDIRFRWNGPSSSLVLIDDGEGMSEEMLRNAMRPGSSNPLDERDTGDLGRFGLGLKTASFAQARSLTVISRHREGSATRRWDLDHVQATDRWALFATPPAEDSNLPEALTSPTGTIVAWHQMDRMVDDRPSQDARAKKQFLDMVDRVWTHLGMVFHRFLDEDDLTLTVNGRPCEPWDPFLLNHPSTQRLHAEDLELTVAGETKPRIVSIAPYVLPHRSRLTTDEHRRAAGPRGWNLHQGFYVYRARRLIVAGDWFDSKVKPEEHCKLARIAIEVDQTLDSLWALDVRKSRARPPLPLRRDFGRIAQATRERAQDVYRARGRTQVGQGRKQTADPIWIVSSDGKSVTYQVNRDHILVQQTLGALSKVDRRAVDTVLRLAERNIPTAHILSVGYGSESLLDTVEDADTIQQAARSLFDQLLASGCTPKQARETLLAVEPFDGHPAFIDSLEEGPTL